ncbi:MAG: hypothetical protein JO351_06265 [Candidatus Eremiobacteraeota bacterium]|nr:hypothetical protein [Candidatus Eremiobacteraeota bacterium]MBV9056225.1 hypothetical protein [Candidatus Eremiobacteraeota bacterium]
MLLSTVLFAAAAYANLTWRSIGPAVSGGRVTSVAGTPQDDQLYYIGSAGGGVWKSANGGATWEPVFEKQPVAAIGAVAIDPTNARIVWAGTGESNPRNDVSYGDGLYKSTDGGRSWRRVGLAGVWSISRIAIDPKDPRHVVVGAFGDPFKDSPDRGVFVTFDGGASWSKSLYVSPSSGASDVAMNPQDPRVVYAGMWHFRRLPWTFTSGGPDDGLYKSTDGGRSWHKLTGNGMPSGLTGRIGLAIAPSRPNRVFALIEAKGGILWRTDDAGNHWAMTSSDTLVDQRPFYFSHIAVDPKNPNHVYAVSEMLAESTDGGRKFKEIAKGVHVDYHAIWIDPTNSKRVMVGEDGGYALTNDLKHWSFSRNLTIGQVYHVGLSDENPYAVCAAFQDNGGFCGPTNSLDSEGILDRHWTDVVGGDGEWTVPDPGNPRYVFADLEDGALTVFDRTTQVSRFIRPYDAYPGSFLGPFDLSVVPYRFNWDSPVAFAPWASSSGRGGGYAGGGGGSVAWFGGNVVFQSSDRGETWAPISPDLTRDVKAHQVPSGGPLAKDVSGAEYSDTILDIEGSPLRRGEIWAGTDDGYVQVTSDASTGSAQLAHWRNVTPPETPEYARIETVAPSPLVPSTTYVVADNHRMGDYAPYIFVTRDGGSTWTKIVNGLPPNQYARTVRPDSRNPYLLYAGTENGLWISFDGGAHWESFKINLPTVSVRDIRIQPQFNDLVIGTHGRDVWVFDDLGSIQQLGNAERAGAMLFAPRTSYEYHDHSNDLGNYTRFAGENPSRGAIIDFYQSAPQRSAPELQILDAAGHLLRTVKGTHKVNGKEEPFIPNKSGINRYVWNFTEDPPLKWYGAAKEEYQGPTAGPLVVPGTYTARIALNGQTLQQSFTVASDPRDSWTQTEYLAGYAYARKYATIYGKIDEALNNLDAMKKSLAAAASSPRATAALRAQVAGAQAQWSDVFAAFTADYHNDEDSIQRSGSLRESVPRTGFAGTQLPPTAAQLDYGRRFDAAYNVAVAKYNAYVASLRPLQAALQQAGLKAVEGAKPVTP